jgi:FdhD protein
MERVAAPDAVVVEEPLEIRLHGVPFSVTMRTPGADRELAAGFLLSERVVRGADDVGTIEYCTDRVPVVDEQDDRGSGEGDARTQRPASNVVNVTLTDPTRADRFLAAARRVTTSSACGLCGRRTIESLTCEVPPLHATWTCAPGTLAALPERLRAAQPLFDATGGLHAAGLFAPDGTLIDGAEDVGRHNAVDKVIGRRLMLDALPASDCLLFVSGRSSFEIVQKALFAGIPVVASVSAPSSLAVDLAATAGITLVGFVRGETFNIYTHAQRIQPEA